MKSTPRVKPTEKETQKTILQYLNLKKYVFWRVNNGSVFDPGFGGFRKMASFSRKGVADIYVLKGGVSYFIEVKGYSGKLSEDQIEFQKDIEREGGIFILAKSIDDVLKAGL